MKKMTLVCTLVLFVISAGAATARTIKCKVESVNDSTVIMDCGKKAEKLDVGSKVDVKVDKKMAVEGC